MMNDEEWIIAVILRHIMKSIREADTSTIHYSLFTIHYSFPIGEGIKNTHPLTKIRGGIRNVFHGSTLVTAGWLSLIDALTGAPGLPFPANGSEVVSSKGNCGASHQPALLCAFPKGCMSSSQPVTPPNLAHPQTKVKKKFSKHPGIKKSSHHPVGASIALFKC